jgi:adenosine kinase
MISDFKLLSVIYSLQVLEKYSTGTCVCLINGAHRSLYANIGAALQFQKNLLHLNNISHHQTIFYIEGYFVSEKIDVCRHIFEKYCQTSASILATNLNASYILETYGDDMKFLVQSSTLVFGNRKEFETLALIYECDDIDHLAEHLVRFCKTERGHTEKVLVITDGNKPILVFHGDETSFQKCIFAVPEVQTNKIVDTTGAGDSFVAGFLYKYLRKKNLVECVSFGNEISGRVIKTIGCNLPESAYNSTCRIL